MLTDDQLRRFAIDGFIVVPGVVPEELLARADAEIDALTASDPPDATSVGPHFYFLPPEDLPAADAALRESGALTLAEQLTAPLELDLELDHIQVALNVQPYSHVPGGPHIDGHRPDEPVWSFTMLAAIYLSDETSPHSGNLWVWPGSHLGHQNVFRERGVDALVATSGHVDFLQPPVHFGAPQPVLARRGDLLLAHFLLGHNTGGNTTDHVRRILYYRLGAEGHRQRWADTFLDAFTEYAPLRALVAGQADEGGAG